MAVDEYSTGNNERVSECLIFITESFLTFTNNGAIFYHQVFALTCLHVVTLVKITQRNLMGCRCKDLKIL